MPSFFDPIVVIFSLILFIVRQYARIRRDSRALKCALNKKKTKVEEERAKCPEAALSIRDPSSLRIGRPDKCLLYVMVVLWFTVPFLLAPIHGTLDRRGDSAFPDCSSNHSVTTIRVHPPPIGKSDTYPSLASCHSGSCQYSLPTRTNQAHAHSSVVLLFACCRVVPPAASIAYSLTKQTIPPLVFVTF